MQRNNEGVRLQVQRGPNRAEQTINVRLVIGADGSHSAVAKGIGTGAAQETIVAVGGEVTMQAQNDDMVEVYVQLDLAPGWFGWTIPLSAGVSRIGIGSDERGKNPRRLLEGLMERHEHLRGSIVLRLQGGAIPDGASSADCGAAGNVGGRRSWAGETHIRWRNSYKHPQRKHMR